MRQIMAMAITVSLLAVASPARVDAAAAIGPQLIMAEALANPNRQDGYIPFLFASGGQYGSSAEAQAYYQALRQSKDDKDALTLFLARTIITEIAKKPQQQPSTTTSTTSHTTFPTQSTGGNNTTWGTAGARGNENVHAWLSQPSGSKWDQAFGKFKMTVNVQPPHPIEGYPVKAQVQVWVSDTNYVLDQILLDNLPVQPDQWITLADQAAAGVYTEKHTVLVVVRNKYNNSVKPWYAAYVNYAVNATNANASDANQADVNTQTFDLPACEGVKCIGALRANADALIANSTSQAPLLQDIDVRVKSVRVLNGRKYYEVMDAKGDTILVAAPAKTPDWVKAGSDIHVTGRLTQDASGNLMVDAKTITGIFRRTPVPGQTGHGGAGSGSLAAKQAETLARKNAALAAAQNPGFVSTPPVTATATRPSAAERVAANTPETAQQTTPQQDVLTGMMTAPDYRAITDVTDVSPGAKSARTMAGLIASTIGVAIGTAVVFGVGAVSAPLIIGTLGVGALIMAFTGGFPSAQDFGVFVRNPWVLTKWAFINHPGELLLEGVLGAAFCGLPLLGALAGRGLAAAGLPLGERLLLAMPNMGGILGRRAVGTAVADIKAAQNLSTALSYTTAGDATRVGLTTRLGKAMEVSVKDPELAKVADRLGKPNVNITGAEFRKIKNAVDGYVKDPVLQQAAQEADDVIARGARITVDAVAKREKLKDTKTGLYDMDNIKTAPEPAVKAPKLSTIAREGGDREGRVLVSEFSQHNQDLIRSQAPDASKLLTREGWERAGYQVADDAQMIEVRRPIHWENGKAVDFETYHVVDVKHTNAPANVTAEQLIPSKNAPLSYGEQVQQQLAEKAAKAQASAGNSVTRVELEEAVNTANEYISSRATNQVMAEMIDSQLDSAAREAARTLKGKGAASMYGTSTMIHISK